MKTKITLKHGNEILKIDDTDYDEFPEEGDVVEMDEAGETQKFRVTGIESAVVILETVPDNEEITPTRESSRSRTDKRLAAERDFRAHRSTNAARAETSQRIANNRPHDSSAQAVSTGNTKTFRVARSADKSKTLSKTAKGNKTSRVARASAKK